MPQHEGAARGWGQRFLASLASGAEHHVVASPYGPTSAAGKIRELYTTMFGDLKGVWCDLAAIQQQLGVSES